jgi:hypothetical protein
MAHKSAKQAGGGFPPATNLTDCEIEIGEAFIERYIANTDNGQPATIAALLKLGFTVIPPEEPTYVELKVKGPGRPAGTKGETREGIEREIKSGYQNEDIAHMFSVTSDYVQKIRRELDANGGCNAT